MGNFCNFPVTRYCAEPLRGCELRARRSSDQAAKFWGSQIGDLGSFFLVDGRLQTAKVDKLGTGDWLRGPAAILFISGNTSSDSIAKMFSCLFLWGIAQISRDTLQNWVSHGCVCVKSSTKGGYLTILGGVLPSLKKYRTIWGIAAIVQKRPDVHKIVLSIKLRSPPPGKMSILGIFY